MELSRKTTATKKEADQAFLRRTVRPDYETGAASFRLIDLFSGCGALTLGFAEAARRLGFAIDVRLAVDGEPDAAAVFEHNFPAANVRCTEVEGLFDGDLGSKKATRTEREIAREVGEVDAIIAGPPCQGHSSLNNHTRSDDPRNTLYGRVVRAAEVLSPALVVIENVPGVVRDRRSAIPAAMSRLAEVGYAVIDHTVAVDRLGVPQRRRRHLLVAARGFEPVRAFEELVAQRHRKRDVRWAIGDLVARESMSAFDSPSQLSRDNRKRVEWLFAKDRFDLPNRLRPQCHRETDHTYKSMYGRLGWDQPAQTITTGFGSPGQGRYVHPSRPRTITPHEASRLQTIPDFFSFGAASCRRAWAHMIGNAVPPLLALRLGLVLLPELLPVSFGNPAALAEAA